MTNQIPALQSYSPGAAHHANPVYVAAPSTTQLHQSTFGKKSLATQVQAPLTAQATIPTVASLATQLNELLVGGGLNQPKPQLYVLA